MEERDAEGQTQQEKDEARKENLKLLLIERIVRMEGELKANEKK